MLLDDGPDDTVEVDDKPPAGTAEVPEAAAEEAPTLVSLTPKLSRAQKAAADLQKSIDDRLTQSREEHAREMRELRAELSASRQPVYAQPAPQQQAPAAELPDPEAILAEATKALDDKDFARYQKLIVKAGAAQAMRDMAPQFSQARQSIQQVTQSAGANQVPPAVMARILQHPDIASHPQHMGLLENKAAELNLRLGPARNPAEAQARIARVFSEVDGMIKGEKNGGKPAPSYSRSSASALSGVPTSRGAATSNGSGEPGVELTADEKKVAIKSGMGLTRYAAQVAKIDPTRVRR